MVVYVGPSGQPLALIGLTLFGLGFSGRVWVSMFRLLRPATASRILALVDPT